MNTGMYFFVFSDGHTTTTTATGNGKSEESSEKEKEENSTSLFNRALFIWFDKFVLLGQNREFTTKNLWHLDPEYR